MRSRTQAVYVISVAAELAGMHPQTLRIYERKGLLEPARTAGGNRRYSDEDIERLRRISDLAAEGMNLAGIRRVMELEEEVLRLRAELERAAVRRHRCRGRRRAPPAPGPRAPQPGRRRLRPVGSLARQELTTALGARVAPPVAIRPQAARGRWQTVNRSLPNVTEARARRSAGCPAP